MASGGKSAWGGGGSSGGQVWAEREGGGKLGGKLSECVQGVRNAARGGGGCSIGACTAFVLSRRNCVT